MLNFTTLWDESIYLFANEISEKDVVFARRGNRFILGRGVVASDYYYSDRGELSNERKVNWERKGESDIDFSVLRLGAYLPTLKELTIEKYNEELDSKVKSDSFHDVTPADGQNDENEGQAAKAEAAASEEPKQEIIYQLDYSQKLLDSKNLILHGAPGTGKTYLAKQIAADIVSNGDITDYEKLSVEQKKQIEFVQFHPNYDYSDFVEGLRPKMNNDDTMGFELKDGIFKEFIDLARDNYENAEEKTDEDIEKEATARKSLQQFFDSIEQCVKFKTKTGREFTIDDVDEKYITISIPSNRKIKELKLNYDDVLKLLESDKVFTEVKDITEFFGKTNAKHDYSYYLIIYQEVKKIMEKTAPAAKAKPERTKLKKYVFIIDEINRGEISKIFGELFFSIDPGYRGRAGEISTQFSNLHDTKEKFYIPDNVYIIGTMNDIDRSVDSLDFAMRRRFRFVELKANDKAAAEKMLKSLENDELKAEAIKRMMALNEAIASVDGLNENYQIGAAYFLKLKTLTFDKLWEDYLQPLLQEYIHGMHEEKKHMKDFEEAYGYKKSAKGESDEQGNS